MTMPSFRRIHTLATVSAIALLTGCAGGHTSSQPLQGVSAGVAWEIIDLRQRASTDGRAIRWYYTIVLKEVAGRAVDFKTIERSMHGQLSVETAETFPFTRHLAPKSDQRLSVWDGVRRNAFAPGTFGGVGQEPVRVLRRFRGRDESGTPVTVDVQVQLHAGVGSKAPVPAAIELPPATTLDPGDVRSLAGIWRGYYRDDSPFAVPLQLTVAEDGTFEGTIDEPVTSRFRGKLAIRDGRVAYARGADTGTLTLHRGGADRVLDGTITGTREGQQAGTTYPVSFTFRLAAVGRPSATPEPAPLTNDGVIAMVKAGLDENVILQKIQTTPPAFDVRYEELLRLRSAGVSNRIVDAMIARMTKP
jgi:hypothetical protein